MRLMLPTKTVWEEKASLLHALGLDEMIAPIISVVGAGGKTRTIEQLAIEYKQLRRKVIITTTTHMFRPVNFLWCSEESTQLLKNYLERDYAVWMGLPCDDEKMTAPKLSFLDELKEFDIPILIEADGAKRLPFKVPNAKEPVILSGSHMVIGVLGMDALGKTIKDICFRPEMIAQYLHKTEDELITKVDYIEVIKGSNGLMKGVTGDMKFVVILNKVDNDERAREAFRIREILKRLGILRVYLTSYQFKGQTEWRH